VKKKKAKGKNPILPKTHPTPLAAGKEKDPAKEKKKKTQNSTPPPFLKGTGAVKKKQKTPNPPGKKIRLKKIGGKVHPLSPQTQKKQNGQISPLPT